MSKEKVKQELLNTSQRHTGVHFLSPTGLQLTPTEITKFLLIGSCTAELWKHFWTKDDAAKCDFVFTNHLAELPTVPPSSLEEYDFQVIQIPLRSLLADHALWQLSYDDVDGHAKAFEEARKKMLHQLELQTAWHEKSGLLTFVANFLVPQVNPVGRLLPRYDLRNPVYFFEQLNKALNEAVEQMPNAYILDQDQIANSIGKRGIHEDSIGWIAHGAYIPHLPENNTRILPALCVTDHYHSDVELSINAVWTELKSMFRTIRQVDAVKLVVVDLDDTLWAGVIGDQSEIGPHMVEEQNWPMGVLEALGYLKKRGVLLAIISKNDDTKVREHWPKIIGNKLPLDNFAAVKINWNSKADNMRSILESVNVLPRNVVFVDDNPVERASMQAAYPEIRVLDGFHYYWKRTLLWSPETQVPTISTEATRRTAMVRAQVERESAKQEMSRSEFLATLGLKVGIIGSVRPEDPRFGRALELVNKTNQFNTTGKRWTSEELAQYVISGGDIFAFDAEDKFTHYGIIGFALFKDLHMTQFVMSCRVAGLDVDLAAFWQIVTNFRAGNIGQLSAEFRQTDANYLAKDFLTRAGFQQNDPYWTLEVSAQPEKPAHVVISNG